MTTTKEIKENFINLKAQVENEATIVSDTLKVIEMLKKRVETDNGFALNLASLFNNLALLNPQASHRYIPMLEEDYKAEAERLNLAIENINRYNHDQ